MNIDLRLGDCVKVMAELPDNSVDTIITDPPYHLTSIVKRFGGDGAAPAQFGTDGAFARASKGFMGKTWDGGDVAFRVETWRQAFRVLKPGGFLLAFGGTRTCHRMACAIEDAGFEIRDQIDWIYSQGFPKSYNIAKGVSAFEKNGMAHPKSLRMARMGKEYKQTGQEDYARGRMFGSIESDGCQEQLTDNAKTWDGWGASLKPAHEPIVVAMKPVDRTYVNNALTWGVAGLWIDGGRIGTDEELGRNNHVNPYGSSRTWNVSNTPPQNNVGIATKGRFPSNIILSYPEDEYELRDDVTPSQLRELARWFDENA